MSNISLEGMLDAVQSLTADEQRRLRARLDQCLAKPDEAAGIEAFHRALLASGLVAAIKPPSGNTSSPRRLIEVKGQPLSETIIEERR